MYAKEQEARHRRDKLYDLGPKASKLLKEYSLGLKDEWARVQEDSIKLKAYLEREDQVRLYLYSTQLSWPHAQL